MANARAKAVTGSNQLSSQLLQVMGATQVSDSESEDEDDEEEEEDEENLMGDIFAE